MNHEPSARLRMRVLHPEQTRQVHRSALNTLAGTGIAVGDDDTRRRLFDLGCREGADGRVTFGDRVVAHALASLPKRVVLFDRNGRAAVDTAEETPRFCPGVNCIDVIDHRTGERRPCTSADVADAVTLCEALPNIDMAANLGNPGDLAVADQAMGSVRILVANTGKPFPFIAHDEAEAGRIWSFLAEVAGGWEALASRPFAIDLTGPTSPLTMKAEACRRLRHAAARRLPVVCYPALFPGMTGPVTLAGALAQSAAEVLAGIVIHQAEAPGSPLISGSFVLPMDMRTVSLSYGSPEYILAGMATVDYLGDIGVPAWIGAGCSDAHVFDAQAAAEAGANITAAVLSGTALVHNLGFLSAGKAGSLEMLVACDDMAGAARRFASAMTVSQDHLAEAVIAEAGPSGRYLGHPHTRAHVRGAMWIPTVFQRFDVAAWRRAGARPARDAIRERIAGLLGR